MHGAQRAKTLCLSYKVESPYKYFHLSNTNVLLFQGYKLRCSWLTTRLSKAAEVYSQYSGLVPLPSSPLVQGSGRGDPGRDPSWLCLDRDFLLRLVFRRGAECRFPDGHVHHGLALPWFTWADRQRLSVRCDRLPADLQDLHLLQ